VTKVGELSPQDLYYCGDDRTSCDTGAGLKATLGQLEKRQLLLEDCLPYQQPDLRGVATRQQLCAKSCADTSPLASKGSFSYVPITQLWKAQQHIRQYEAVVSRRATPQCEGTRVGDSLVLACPVSLPKVIVGSCLVGSCSPTSSFPCMYTRTHTRAHARNAHTHSPTHDGRSNAHTCLRAACAYTFVPCTSIMLCTHPACLCHSARTRVV
jgi:hypothetical protein